MLKCADLLTYKLSENLGINAVYYLLTNPRIMVLQFKFGSYVTSLSCVFTRVIGNLSASKSGEDIGGTSFCVSTALK